MASARPRRTLGRLGQLTLILCCAPAVLGECTTVVFESGEDELYPLTFEARSEQTSEEESADSSTSKVYKFPVAEAAEYSSPVFGRGRFSWFLHVTVPSDDDCEYRNDAGECMISVFLDVLHAREHPMGWKMMVNFTLTVFGTGTDGASNTYRRAAAKQFKLDEVGVGVGWYRFISLDAVRGDGVEELTLVAGVVVLADPSPPPENTVFEAMADTPEAESTLRLFLHNVSQYSFGRDGSLSELAYIIGPDTTSWSANEYAGTPPHTNARARARALALQRPSSSHTRPSSSGGGHLADRG
jgi:hypothetical protein